MAATTVSTAEDTAVRALTARAMGRSEWTYSTLALASAFFSGFVALRVAANVLMAVDIAARGGAVQVRQFASAHVVVLVALCAWTAVRRVAGVRAALRSAPWIGGRPGGKRYARRCERRSVFFRAGFLVPAGAGLLMIAAAAALEPDAGMVLALCASLVLGTVVLASVAASLPSRLGVHGQLLEVLQVVGLLVVLSANPEVAPAPGGVSILLFYRPVPVNPVLVLALSLAAGLAPLPACGLLALVDRLARFTRARVPRSALMVWYRRVTTGPWIIILLLMLPVQITQNIDSQVRRWLCGVAAAGLIGWFVAVIGQMDQTLTYRWNRPLARRSQFPRLVPLAGVHLLLAAIATVPGIVR